MPKFTYVGPHDEVEIPSAGVVCKRGATVEVTEAVAKGLADQPSNWESVKPAVPVTTKKES